jgi:hypothetical protein
MAAAAVMGSSSRIMPGWVQVGVASGVDLARKNFVADVSFLAPLCSAECSKGRGV